MKHDLKSTLTLSSTSLSSGGEGPRTHIQVLANSVVASILILLHYRTLSLTSHNSDEPSCFHNGSDLLVVGIVSNYAAVAADTFSSELGILSKSWPRLITSPTLRKVPPGTNGGVSLAGTVAGLGGAALIAVTSVLLMPFCGGSMAGGWQSRELAYFALAVTLWGGLGSLVDSFLGAVFQASVVDVKSGKIVEGRGGKSVPAKAPEDRKAGGEDSRKVVSGLGVLDNNAVNVLMAAVMSVGGMVVMAFVWGVPLGSIWS